MKHVKMIVISIVLIVALIVAIALLSTPQKSTLEMLYSTELSEDKVAFVYLGYSGVLLRAKDLAIGIDISNLCDVKKVIKMDLLIYTHIHSDHFNAATAEEIFRKTGCFIAAERSVYEALLGKIPSDRLFELHEGSRIEINLQSRNLIITPVYGVHPVRIVVFMLEVDGLRIFHGGDSGYSSALKNLGHAHVAFLPTGDPSPSASPQNAVKMALDLSPKTIILVHGTAAQHDSFLKEFETRQVGEIITPEAGKLYVIQY